MVATKGRPKKEDARKGQYRLRMSAEEVMKLNYISEVTGRSKADVLRDAIRMSYNLERTKRTMDIQ